MNSCEDGPSTDDINYVSFETNPLELVVNRNESNNIDVSLYTTQTYGSERTINIYVDLDQTTADAAAYTVPTTVTIPADTNVGTFNINVSDTNLNESGEVLVLNFEMEEGLFTGDALTLDIALFCPVFIDDYVGTWSGTDSWGYETQIVTTLVGGELMMTGIGYEWMEDAWGEQIQVDTITPVKLTLNEETGSFVIESQPCFTTLYDGDLYPYNVLGKGTINACSGELTLEYLFDQDGWVYDGSDWGPKFKETITVN